jgi:hypothetical protein
MATSPTHLPVPCTRQLCKLVALDQQARDQGCGQNDALSAA